MIPISGAAAWQVKARKAVPCFSAQSGTKPLPIYKPTLLFQEKSNHQPNYVYCSQNNCPFQAMNTG